MNRMHTTEEIQQAVRDLGLWGKLVDNRFSRFHVGDRVVAELYGPGTILGQHPSGHHYAVLFDDGVAREAIHTTSLQPDDSA